MGKLVRMDKSGHTVVAEWSAQGADAAIAVFKEELDAGYYAIVTRGEGHAEQVRELPLDADTVILRRPIAGG